MTADSCFSGGQRFLAAPKLFPIGRGDYAIACAGSTQYSFPLVEHIQRAFALNRKLDDRATDITDVVHLLEDIVNRCLHEEIAPEYATYPGEGPRFSMIFAGFSWKKKQPILKILYFDWKKKKMRSSTPSTIKGYKIAVIGDDVGGCRGKIHNRLEDDKKKGKALDMQPLDILLDYISDTAYPSIGGYPQLIKIYPFSNILPFGFLHEIDGSTKNCKEYLNGTDQSGKHYFITYYGRPLLKYETFPYPILELKTKQIRYMYQRVGDT
ncbi:MAG: hypothetical protein K2K05_10255, partial [Muribaculaceae bacterium]|nr:hypothetical protein [Muribaculaceae bacterium]